MLYLIYILIEIYTEDGIYTANDSTFHFNHQRNVSFALERQGSSERDNLVGNNNFHDF